MLLLLRQFIGKDWGDPANGGVAVILASGTGRCTFGVAERPRARPMASPWARGPASLPSGSTGSGIRHFGRRNSPGYSILREVQKPPEDYIFIESVTGFVPRQIRILHGK